MKTSRLLLGVLLVCFTGHAEPVLVKTARSGAWSAAETWEGGRVPAGGEKVFIRPEHRVTYDVASEAVIRSLHIGGTLSFARDRDTKLCAGLIKVQRGDDTKEEGFDCFLPAHAVDEKLPPGVLEIGTADEPIPSGVRATVRLTYVEGLDKQSCPALIACGGRMDLHGAPLAKTWVKLGRSNDAEITNWCYLAEPVPGWRRGDRVIVTATRGRFPFGMKYEKSVAPNDGTIGGDPQTEEFVIQRIGTEDGMPLLELEGQFFFRHAGGGEFAAEVANLSRNVVVESADPAGVRGHTMYHRGSAGSISYAEFRHLGKHGVLGRYPIHFHLTGDSMRGSSVVGASIWGSKNRAINLHGTHFLIVRDCVAFNIEGHAYYFENGNETYNVLDRNLAALVHFGPVFKDAALPFDRNLGSGFWWSNSRNVFTRNVAVECEHTGFRFEIVKSKDFDPRVQVRQPDGTAQTMDLRTIPFIRFEGNEAHTQTQFAINLGGRDNGGPQEYYADGKRKTEPNPADHLDVEGVGPDRKHPFILRDNKVWNSLWAYHIGSPSVLINGAVLHENIYGFWRCQSFLQEYNRIRATGQETLVYHPRPLATHRVTDEESYNSDIEPVDDLPPATVITSVREIGDGKVRVRGIGIDNETVDRITVNGRRAVETAPNFNAWEVTLDAASEIVAQAIDAAGNAELTPHRMTLPRQPAHLTGSR